ncbi:MAG: protease complex subunit PrcB family protein [Treponema sp.]|nr:protease complex subunit PrcB family protein [Treponema sp.]
MKKYLLFLALTTLSISLFAKGKTDKAVSKNSNMGNEIILQKENPPQPTKEKFPLKKIHPEQELSESVHFQQVPHTVLISGQYLPQNQNVKSIIRSKEELNTAYMTLRKNTITPTIDFEKSIVVFANAGSFSTGGFSIHFLGISQSKNLLEVVFQVQSPPPDAIVTMAFTRPHMLVAIELDDEKMFLAKNNLVSVKILGVRGRNFDETFLEK